MEIKMNKKTDTLNFAYVFLSGLNVCQLVYGLWQYVQLKQTRHRAY